MPPAVGNRLSVLSSTCSRPHVCAASWWMTVACVFALALTRNEKLVMFGLLLPQSMPGATPPTPFGAPAGGRADHDHRVGIVVRRGARRPRSRRSR